MISGIIKNLCDIEDRGSDVNGFDFDVIHESIHHDKDAIISPRFGKKYNEIHGEFDKSIKGWHGIEKLRRGLSRGLIHSAGCTYID